MHFLQASLLLGAAALTVRALPTTNSALPSGFKLVVRDDVKHTSELWDEETGVKLVETETIYFNDEEQGVQRRDEGLQKRCDFYDGHGRMDCGFYSVVFGNRGERGNRKAEGKDVITLTGHGWQTTHRLSCHLDGNKGDTWTSLSSPLPWTVDIYAGSACYGSGSWQQTTINYANQHVLAQSDSRCGGIDSLGSFGRRCIIAVNP